MSKDISKWGPEKIRVQMEKEKITIFIALGAFFTVIISAISWAPRNIPNLITVFLSAILSLPLLYFGLIKPIEKRLDDYAEELDRRESNP